MCLKIRFSPNFSETFVLGNNLHPGLAMAEYYYSIIVEKVDTALRIWSKKHNVDFHSIKQIHSKNPDIIDVILPSDTAYTVFLLTWDAENAHNFWGTMYKVIQD
jgi:hypothetical protein